MKKFYYFSLIVLFSISSVTAQKKVTGINAYASAAWDLTLNMFDGQIGTIWQSGTPDHEGFFIVDLGRVRNVVKLQILWDAANAKDYKLSFSQDNLTYTDELSYTNMPGAQRQDIVDNLNVKARFIKFQGVTLNTGWAYGIYEFEVFEKTSDYYLEISPTNVEMVEGETMQFKVTAKDAVGNPVTLTQPTTWSVSGGGTIDATGKFTASKKGYFSVNATNEGAFIGTNVDVFPALANLSIMGIATASTSQEEGLATNAIDELLSTAWKSVSGGEESITVDLGEKKRITDMLVYWEAANPKNYSIEVSDDNINFTEAKAFINMPTGISLNRTDRVYELTNLQGRYVKLSTFIANTWWPYSMWEFKIFGDENLSMGLSNMSSLVSVYPNPTYDILNFNEEIAKCILYDTVGKVILNKENINHLNIVDLPSGLYLLGIEDKSGKNAYLKIQKL